MLVVVEVGGATSSVNILLLINQSFIRLNKQE